MLRLFFVFLISCFCITYSYNIFALDQMIPASAGIVDPDYNDCVFDADGSVSSISSSCYLFFNIPYSTGTYDVNSITSYYYDNSGSQRMSIYFRSHSISSTGSYSTISSTSDTSTSSSVQSKTLSFSTTDIASTSYFYYIRLVLDDGTKLLGIKIN